MAVVNSLKALNRESAQVSKSDLYSMDPALLREEKGFNARGAFVSDYFEREDVQAHIRRLADAYKRGDYVPPIVVKVREGEAFIRDGHCRRRAIQVAMDEGAEIRKVQVLEHKGDDAEQAALIVTSNDGLALTPLERAVVYGRLSGWGWSDQETADKVGRTIVHVRQLLEMLEMPLELKGLIQNGQVSASYAAELYKEHGANALEMIHAALDQEGAGAAKVTKKHVKPRRPAMSKKVVKAMHSGISAITSHLDDITPVDGGERYTLTLSKAEVDGFRELKQRLEEFESA